MSSWADYIRTWRKSENLSQERAGHELGVSVQTINRWERGKAEPHSTIMRNAVRDRISGRGQHGRREGVE